jgi:outer membrane protein assembly factor BamB
VISSYAQPLLEGCGTIKKGDLRVVAKTSPVPFVTVFVTASVDADSREQVQSALTDVASHPDILAALESLLGFLPIEESMTVTKKELTRGVVFQFDDDSDRSQAGISRVSWPGWRGPNRDGRVPWLPDLLGFESNVLWEIPIAHAGLGGIAATERYVVFGDRDIDDFNDVFRCLDAASGETIWEVERLAIAALDYGNTPRGTPLISGDYVFCVGAHGHLLCIRLADGVVVWEKNFRDDFPLKVELPWGYCGSPLLVEDKLIVAPGALDASLIALDRATGEIIWKSPGGPPSYGSLNVGVLGGVQQVVGHDATTLGGWDVKSGERLWKMSPDNDGDFNVPTPIIDRGTLIVVTENNGARRFQFDQSGRIIDRPIAVNPKLRAEMSTPVLVGERLFCVDNYLYCLEVDTLDEQWRLRDRALGDYGAIIASEQRLLVIAKGELLLLGTDGDQQILGRQRVFDEKVNLYSHPAIVGNKLYVRGESRLKCLGL